jgi:hypothetical protein
MHIRFFEHIHLITLFLSPPLKNLKMGFNMTFSYMHAMNLDQTYTLTSSSFPPFLLPLEEVVWLPPKKTPIYIHVPPF